LYIRSNSNSYFDNLARNPNFYKQKKQENLKKIMTKMIEEQGITFSPKLNENKTQSVEDNLIKRNEDFLKNKENKLKNAITNEQVECTFSPHINDIKVTYDEPLPVEERLLNYGQLYKQKHENFKENFKENYSFKPEINKNTEEILRNKQEMIEEIKQKMRNKNNKNKEIISISSDRNNINNENKSNKENENYIAEIKKRIKWKKRNKYN